MLNRRRLRMRRRNQNCLYATPAAIKPIPQNQGIALVLFDPWRLWVMRFFTRKAPNGRGSSIGVDGVVEISHWYFSENASLPRASISGILLKKASITPGETDPR